MLSASSNSTDTQTNPALRKPITVIGVGRLGLGFALLLEQAGYDVLGIDIFPDYVQLLNQKTAQFEEPGYNELLTNATNFRASTDLVAGLNHSDIVFIIVQTPNGGGDNFYDHSILSSLLTKINRLTPQNKHFIIGCTVMPHYCDRIGTLLLSNTTNCTLSYNPEFVAQGDIVKGFKYPDIVLVGLGAPPNNLRVIIEAQNANLDPISQPRQPRQPQDQSLETRLREIYTNMVAPDHTPKFCFMTPLEAEIVKIGLNSFITTKIAFANMVYELCTETGANAHTVLNAIGSDSRIGTKYFRPGHSYGGPCFPRDTKAFAQVLKQHDINNSVLLGTIQNNDAHIEYETNQIATKHPNKHTPIIMSGICYKENATIPIIEESAKLKIAKRLAERGHYVVIRDTPALMQEVKKEYGTRFNYETNI